MRWDCIVTCPRHMEPNAMDEALGLLMDMGADSPGAEPTGISGIVVARTGMDPVKFSREVRRLVAEEPWSVRYMSRIIPIHAVGGSDRQSILGMAEGLSSRIAPDATYRVSLKKRNTRVSGRELIRDIASGIPNEVSLEDPDVIVQVEILGGVAGVSILRQGDIFSLEMAKRDITGA